MAPETTELDREWFIGAVPSRGTMWFREDGYTVHTEIIHCGDIDFEIAVRFGYSRICTGRQTYNGKQGWFCAYVVMRDTDFDMISDGLPGTVLISGARRGLVSMLVSGTYDTVFVKDVI